MQVDPQVSRVPGCGVNYVISITYSLQIILDECSNPWAKLYSSHGYATTSNKASQCSPPFMCYACHIHPFPGRFLKEKATALGVPNDGTRALLVAGQSITLADGTVVGTVRLNLSTKYFLKVFF